MSPVVVALRAPRQVELVDEPSRQLAPDEVRVRTLYSGVSAGTEMAFYRGTNPYLHKRWDPELRLFVSSEAQTVEYPLLTWGYEEVGEVVEVGGNVDVKRGTRVFGTWGHRAEYVAPASSLSGRVLPADAEPLLGIFSHIGAIALNGVLDTSVRLGETVAVFGLGVVGQLVAQLLRLAGARVIGVDLLAERRRTAQELGIHVVLDAADRDIGQQVRALTDARGADVCVEASGFPKALHEAIRSCAYASRVVALGFYQGEGLGVFMGEEFHHNRINLVSSQIGGLAPELQHRWDRARLVDTFMQLAISGAVRCTELITHRAPATEAAELFRLIDEQPRSVLQAVLDFRDAR
ncbi:MAG TPA: zinc-binding alcohol dehydrogenase [Chloroflexota bacterium]|jgi:2-desacetyl-2-hydroxyethyl bacteriochlorophyllide A dehydrogenase